MSDDLIDKLQSLKIDDLIASFKQAGLPSRADEESQLRLKDEEILIILDYLQGEPTAKDKRRDYRKLRELTIQCAASSRVHVKVFEASARYSLEESEYSEFIAASSTLISGAYKRDQSLRQPWIYCANLLVHWNLNYGNFSTTFYTERSCLGHLAPSLISLVASIRDGNIVRFDAQMGSLSFLPHKFRSYLRDLALNSAEERFKRAYRELPTEFYTRLKNK